ncbi:hypothetical protein D3C77_603520 [compost metagenome]
MHETNINEQLRAMQQEIDNLEAELTRLEELQTATADEMKETQAAILELEQELQEISQEKDRITRSEAEVKHQLDEVTVSINEVTIESAALQLEASKCNELQQVSNREIAALEYEIKQAMKQEKEHKERLHRYGSSYQVQEELNQLEQSLQIAKDHTLELLLF